MLGGGLIAAAGMLAALALVFTSATGVAGVAADARAQQRAEAALGITAAARYALAQVLVLNELGGTNPAAQDLIRTDVSASLESAESRVEELLAELDEPARTEIQDAWDEASAVAGSFLGLIDAGEIEEAGTLAAGSLAPALDSLTGLLAGERDARAVAIAAAENEVGRVATASRFLVALGIPLVGVVAFFLLLRRRQRRFAYSLALDHERSLNRSKDLLIANLSHELRTPLTSIYGAAATIEETNFDDLTLARELNGMVLEQSRDLTRMVDDLLVSAQAQADRLGFDIQPTEVAAEVDSVLGEFRRSGRAVAVDVVEAVVDVDPLRLRQIVRNFLSNAARHGGDRLAVVGRRAGESYRLSVVDDGPGVPPEVAPELFEPFVHAGQRALLTGSVGLGLSITKILAEGMAASVGYERRSGNTWFTVECVLVPAQDIDPAVMDAPPVQSR